VIVAHNDNYNQFNKLLSKSLDDIQADANQRTDYYLKRGGLI